MLLKTLKQNLWRIVLFLLYYEMHLRPEIQNKTILISWPFVVVVVTQNLQSQNCKTRRHSSAYLKQTTNNLVRDDECDIIRRSRWCRCWWDGFVGKKMRDSWTTARLRLSCNDTHTHASTTAFHLSMLHGHVRHTHILLALYNVISRRDKKVVEWVSRH